MRKERILAMIMSVLMMIAMLPSAVFAEEAAVLEGKLKIHGVEAESEELSADLREVKPEGITEEDVTYLWSRKTAEDEALEEAGEKPELKELGKDKKYTVTKEDIGAKIVLTITAKEESAFSGSLTAVSDLVIDAQTAAELKMNEAQEVPAEEPAEEILPEENTDAMAAAYSEDAGQVDDENAGEEPVQEDTDTASTIEDEWTQEAGSAADGIPEATEDGTYINEDDSMQEAEQSADGELHEEESTAADENSFPDENVSGGDDGENEEAVAVAKAEVTVGDGSSDTIDFGNILPEQLENTESQQVTVTNTGDIALHFEDIAPEYFAVEDITEPLEPGESVELWVIPRGGTEPGYYENTIVYKSAEGAEAAYTAKAMIVSEETEEPSAEPTPTEEAIPTSEPEEPSAEPTPTEEPIPAYSEVTADITGIDCGTLIQGYTTEHASEKAQTVTLSNTGTADAVLGAAVSSTGSSEGRWFDFTWTAQTLGAGEQVSFSIQPKEGLTPETYEESFTIKEEDTERTIVITAKVVVAAQKHELVLSTSRLDFASAKKGYSDIGAQTITITNSGNVTETLSQPVGTYFDITLAEGSLELAAGASVSFRVQPKSGLDVNTWDETVTAASAGTSVSFSMVFQVIKGTASVTAVQQPSAITGLPNGTRKDSTSLKLPSTVVLETTNGKVKASVSWNVNECAYKQNSTEAQKFKVSGTVKLPSGVDNDNKINLIVSVEVSVQAYAPKTALAENNIISGIDRNGVYTTQSKISFTATGAGMDNQTPRKGDTRYVPQSWTVINTNGWSGAPYTGTFGLSKSGDYTLKVVFGQQQFDGALWKSTGITDVKQVAFSVSKAEVTVPGTNLTPAANKTAAVKTGDDTTILPFVIILIAAAAVIGGVVFYKRKNDK